MLNSALGMPPAQSALQVSKTFLVLLKSLSHPSRTASTRGSVLPTSDIMLSSTLEVPLARSALQVRKIFFVLLRSLDHPSRTASTQGSVSSTSDTMLSNTLGMPPIRSASPRMPRPTKPTTGLTIRDYPRRTALIPRQRIVYLSHKTEQHPGDAASSVWFFELSATCNKLTWVDELSSSPKNGAHLRLRCILEMPSAQHKYKANTQFQPACGYLPNRNHDRAALGGSLLMTKRLAVGGSLLMSKRLAAGNIRNKSSMIASNLQ